MALRARAERLEWWKGWPAGPQRLPTIEEYLRGLKGSERPPEEPRAPPEVKTPGIL